MSRSNPNVNAPNPAMQWFEWNGEHGMVRYYDKEAKKNVDVALPFTFLLLDELASVRGWHDASESGIYSNEVKDTRTEILVVKSFKGGTLAEGLYKDIKDRVATLGGQFVANCYIAFKHGDALTIGSLRFKGAALGAWMEFRKARRASLYSQAIDVSGYTEGKKGRIVFRVPTFTMRSVTVETNAAAVGLDKELQRWLADYFSRRTSDRATTVQPDEREPGADDAPLHDEDNHGDMISDQDIPF